MGRVFVVDNNSRAGRRAQETKKEGRIDGKALRQTFPALIVNLGLGWVPSLVHGATRWLLELPLPIGWFVGPGGGLG